LKNRNEKSHFLRVFDDVSDSCSDSFYRPEDGMGAVGIQCAVDAGAIRRKRVSLALSSSIPR
jgi:hypothetical protein